MADPVPPNVTEDQLRLLLDQQSETEVLDYKSELDLVDKSKKSRAQIELAKDIAALLSGRGGHLVIGTDENGKVPLRLLIETAPAQASFILAPDPDEEPEDLDSNQDVARAELGALLDKIVALAARGLVLQNNTLLELALEALRSIYGGVADQYGRERPDLMLAPAEVWLALIERAYALGALAVRKRRWRAVAELALQRPEVLREYRYRSWLRHAHVMAARAGLLRDPEAERVGASLLQLALAHIVSIPELRPDYGADDDRLLSSLAQFDILANLAVASVAGSVQSAGVYPHFRRFYGFRSDPAVVALLDDENARSEIYPESDTKLAQALRDLGQIGSGEFFYVNGWDEYEDERIRSFLSEHPPS